MPVAPERLAVVPGLPIPELESGPLDLLPRAAAVLAWAETPQAAAHRGPVPPGPRRPEDRYPLWEVPWHLRPPAPEVVATVHHRAFALDVARDLGRELPGAWMVSSLGQLEAHLRAMGPGAWVVKASLSAAGRARHIERSPEPVLSPAARLRVGRLLALHGPLLFEPWKERVEDVGCATLILPEEHWLVGSHNQIVDREGRFRGIELTVDPQGMDRPQDWESQLLLAFTVYRMVEALEEAGYHGPFGIDAFRHRLSDGRVVLHPLGELNARMTFGLVARALVRRLREPLGLAPLARVRLLFGPRLPEGASVPLLLPGDPGKEGAGGAAWLEIVS
ncbi:MAG TPA: hypothetical protein VGR07_18600 [Thermoanaerobaculia bacterium]|nr:hypothetical protein [Thermoanaerobaculia bacterium]